MLLAIIVSLNSTFSLIFQTFSTYSNVCVCYWCVTHVENMECILLLISSCSMSCLCGISEGFIDLQHTIQSLVSHKKKITPLWGRNMCIFIPTYEDFAEVRRSMVWLRLNANFWGHFCEDSKMSPYSELSPQSWCAFICLSPYVCRGERTHTYTSSSSFLHCKQFLPTYTYSSGTIAHYCTLYLPHFIL